MQALKYPKNDKRKKKIYNTDNPECEHHVNDCRRICTFKVDNACSQYPFGFTIVCSRYD